VPPFPRRCAYRPPPPSPKLPVAAVSGGAAQPASSRSLPPLLPSFLLLPFPASSSFPLPAPQRHLEVPPRLSTAARLPWRLRPPLARPLAPPRFAFRRRHRRVNPRSGVAGTAAARGSVVAGLGRRVSVPPTAPCSSHCWPPNPRSGPPGAAATSDVLASSGPCRDGPAPPTADPASLRADLDSGAGCGSSLRRPPTCRLRIQRCPPAVSTPPAGASSSDMVLPHPSPVVLALLPLTPAVWRLPPGALSPRRWPARSRWP
jgi:hypothetical protein